MKQSITQRLTLAAVMACLSLASATQPPKAFGSQSQANEKSKAIEKGKTIEKGKVIEKVVCRSDSQQSYALFVPSKYTHDKRWPIIYCFDPGARGLLPVERFKEAAEKYGYIVVGSNNSRNGPTDVSLAAANAMFDDTQARFSVDDRRVYTAGFSGGARVASSIGYSLAGPIAGVISCGAGFPPGLAPSRATPFPLFGSAGIEDFNFPEMKQLSRSLDSVGVANRIAVFEGGHEWPPSSVCMEALEWMELQAMKSGRRTKDEPLIEELFNKRAARVLEFEAAKKTYDAFIESDAIARDFKGLKDSAAFERRAAELKESKEVKLAIKQEQEMEKEQNKRINELFALKQNLKDSESRIPALADIKRNIANLKKRSDEKDISSEKIAARRILNQFFVILYEESRSLLSRKQYDQAAENFSILAIISPDNPRVYYSLACAYSLNKDKARAIEALKKSVEKGFADRAAVESNKDLDPLREDEGYKQVIEDLKKKSG